MDSKVQSLKSKAISLGRDISILEEELLFPPSTQFAIYLSGDVDGSFKLISAQIKVDGRIIKNHLYTAGDQEALAAGGIQELYLGNIKTGNHKIQSTYMGKTGDSMKRFSIDYSFEKTADPIYLEMNIKAKEIGKMNGMKAPKFSVKKWK
jgi:hypothetical protein